MIVTLTLDKINIPSDGYCCTISDETIEKHITSGLKSRRKISYKLHLNNRELQLECPLIKNPHQNTVIWPAFKLPYRKYPAHIYLYAAALYLSSNLSMRKVAAKVRRTFGLEKFSHSTLSRTLKKLAENALDLSKLNITDTPNCKNTTDGKSLIPRRNWDTTRQDKYRLLLQILIPVLDKSRTIEYGSLLNYSYFNETNNFLI